MKKLVIVAMMFAAPAAAAWWPFAAKDGNVVPDWNHGAAITARLVPDGSGGFYLLLPRKSEFVSKQKMDEQARAEAAQKQAEEAKTKAAVAIEEKEKQAKEIADLKAEIEKLKAKAAPATAQ